MLLALHLLQSVAIVFHGFHDDDDMPEFAEFVFSRLKMDFTSFGGMKDPPSPTIH